VQELDFSVLACPAFSMQAAFRYLHEHMNESKQNHSDYILVKGKDQANGLQESNRGKSSERMQGPPTCKQMKSASKESSSSSSILDLFFHLEKGTGGRSWLGLFTSHTQFLDLHLNIIGWKIACQQIQKTD
jgi:hypothetical protein